VTPPTVFDNYVVNIEVDGNYVELALWDTSGAEDNERIRPLSYAESHVILLCFKIDDPGSLDDVQEKWVWEARHFCPDAPVILVGCKKDLRHNPTVIEELKRTRQRPVTPEEGAAVATKIGANMYLECSARTGEGVRAVFQEATRFALLPKVAKKENRGCEIL